MDENGKRKITPTGDPAAGAVIKELREKAGLSRKKLAAKIGRSESWLGNIETGLYPISPEKEKELYSVLENHGENVKNGHRLVVQLTPEWKSVMIRLSEFQRRHYDLPKHLAVKVLLEKGLDYVEGHDGVAGWKKVYGV